VNTGPPSSDFITTQQKPSFWQGTTIIPEYPEDPRINVTAVWTEIQDYLNFQTESMATFIFSIASSRDSGDDHEKTAMEQWIEASKLGGLTLYREHANAWASLLESRIEVNSSDFRIPAAINASLASLLSELRSDWPVGGIASGGIGTNGKYHGHVFWEAETFMGPPLLLLFPEKVRTMLQYRISLQKGAREKAASYSPPYSGTMFPWESAAYGNETCPYQALTGIYEQHITGDIGIAVQRYWWHTRDVN